nr:hypothetical protein [uncultured Draconibacterium sp.]
MYNWVSILIPFFIGIYRYKHLDKSLRLFLYFVVYGTVTEIVSRIVIRYGLIIYNGETNTLPITHLYLLAEFLILGLFYSHILKDILQKRVIITLVVLFVVYCIINTLFLQSIFTYAAFPHALSKILLVGFSILFFYKVMIDASIPNLWKEPLVYINLAVLIYYSGSLFYSLLFNVILDYSREFAKVTNYYFAALNTLFYILVAIGFWKSDR